VARSPSSTGSTTGSGGPLGNGFGLGRSGRLCINYRRRTLDVVTRWEFTESRRDFAVKVDGRVILDDDAMVDAAPRGLGLAYVMEHRVRDHLAAGQLVRVLARYCVPFDGLYLYYPSRAQIAPKVQAFVDFFKRPKRQERRKRAKPT